MAETPEQFRSPGVLLNGIVGADLASAATVAPTHMIHSVTGTAAIVNITVPYPGFAGIVIFLPTAIWTWTAAGNISVLGTTTAAGGMVIFCYNPITNKWNPHRVA